MTMIIVLRIYFNFCVTSYFVVDVLALGSGASISLAEYFFFKFRLYDECTLKIILIIFNTAISPSLTMMMNRYCSTVEFSVFSTIVKLLRFANVMTLFWPFSSFYMHHLFTKLHLSILFLATLQKCILLFFFLVIDCNCHEMFMQNMIYLFIIELIIGSFSQILAI